jgi:adenylyltransferase/sulfurtransferase
LDELVANPAKHLPDDPATETYILCRLGNDSQAAVTALKVLAQASETNGPVIKDVIGGLRAWTRQVDANFPMY